MPRILPFIEGFLIDKLLNSSVILSKKSKVRMILLGLATICLVAALILSIIALYYWLLTRSPVDVAATCAAAMIFTLAVLFGLTSYALAQKRQSRLHVMQKDLADKIMNLIEAAAEEMEIPEHVSNHPKTAMALATLAGFIIAERAL